MYAYAYVYDLYISDMNNSNETRNGRNYDCHYNCYYTYITR